MWRLLLIVTLMGVRHEYVLPGHYETKEKCAGAITWLMALYEVRKEVDDATIQCVSGWHINFTGESDAH